MRRERIGQRDAQTERNHRQHDGHTRLLKPAIDRVEQKQQADADVEHALHAQIMYADGQNLALAGVDEQREQRPRKEEDQRGNDGAEGE